MNKDTVVGILGAVILVAAMVGIFYYEGTQAPGGIATGGGGTGPLALTWRTVTAAGPGDSGNLAPGASEEGAANISAANLTAVTFTLTWNDPGNNANFILEVTDPNGRTLSDESSEGTAEVVFSPINPTPTAERGSSADLNNLRTMNGTGTWAYTVTLSADENDPPAPGVPVAPPGGLPVGGDAGNDWALAVEMETYTADAAAA